MNSEIQKAQIRHFVKGDITFALEQTGREGWDATAPFFEALLVHDPRGAFVAELQGRPAGMVTTTRYTESGWIGNLIVPPEFRGFSIGSTLMQHAIRHLEEQGTRSIRLEADPLGINIYRRLGFVDEYDSPRFQIDEYNFSFPSTVAVLEESDLPEIAAMDAHRFGDDRRRMLGVLFKTKVAAYRTPCAGSIAGYLFVQPSKAGYRLGPWIADNPYLAHELLSAALNATRPKSVIVALPGINSGGVRLLGQNGFRQTPSSLRMLRGPMAARGISECVYGLAGGAIG